MPVENFPESNKKEKLIYDRVGSASTLSILERVQKISNDPECKRAMDAVGRTLINVGVSAVDLFPGIGEAVETGVLAAKVSNPAVRYVAGIFGKRAVELVKKLDTTPNVTTGQTLVTAAILAPAELATFGTAPTFVASALRQLIYDYKNGNFKGVERIIKILTTGEDLPISPEDQKLLDEAAKEF
jgi:hypothetical protein